MSPERPVLAAMAALLFAPMLPAEVPYIRLDDAPAVASPPAIGFTLPRDAQAHDSARRPTFTIAAHGPVVAFSLPPRASNPTPMPVAPMRATEKNGGPADARVPGTIPGLAAGAKPSFALLSITRANEPADTAALSDARLPAKFVNPFAATRAPDPEPKADTHKIDFAIPRYELTPLERDTIATCLVLEAASQGEFGMRGVMAVIRNRAHGQPELFAPTVLAEKQFSALNPLTAGHVSLWRMITRAQRDQMWSAALRIVDDATKDTWHDPTAGATHYTRTGERTPWARALARTVTIGRHAFYR